MPIFGSTKISLHFVVIPNYSVHNVTKSNFAWIAKFSFKFQYVFVYEFVMFFVDVFLLMLCFIDNNLHFSLSKPIHQEMQLKLLEVFKLLKQFLFINAI